ncbi:conserved hypothetical protein [Frankia canadensis]|uniref:Uncharacterized protein n=1 Tax=Frankia canadensis TaxID=1836972 RepID=A0A2I2KZX1_9ACTN|nr:hypothetical protein [Frankia canadensis]SNQ51200.1 conserved hypothetical protein [Frankia canadensis]SOU58490.1 conserved hypothetical protein [Frankia canadensis]
MSPPPAPASATIRPLAVSDRLRLEVAVWSLDAHLADLPRRARVAHRREMRTNLHAAARDVGTAEALRRLGPTRRLAAGYLAAEFGEWQPRPAWRTASAIVLLAVLMMTELVTEAQNAFADGVRAIDPHATGTFHWPGFRYLIDDTTYTFTDGRYTSVGGAWTPLFYALLAAATIVGGRLWRLLPAWRRHHIDD